MNARIVDKELEEMLKKIEELGKQWFELTNLADKQLTNIGSVPAFAVDRLEEIAKEVDDIQTQIRNRPNTDKVLKRLMHIVNKSNSAKLAKYRQHIG